MRATTDPIDHAADPLRTTAPDTRRAQVLAQAREQVRRLTLRRHDPEALAALRHRLRGLLADARQVPMPGAGN